MEKPIEKNPWLYDVLFVFVLIIAAYLRFSGSDWGELQHQHPDEGFLTAVTYDIAPIGQTETLGLAPTSADQPWRSQYPDTYTDCEDWGGYFDTACSPLNPHNRGKAFYTYGTLPVFFVRYMAEWFDQLGNLKQFGRQMSAAMDLLTILVLYIIVVRIYGRRVGLIAAVFSSLAVMQIQQSHFYTTDLFANFFLFLAIYFAVEIALGKKLESQDQVIDQASSFSQYFFTFIRQKEFIFSLFFGVAFGMAVACKLNAVPLALILPLAFFIRHFKQGHSFSTQNWYFLGGFLILGALSSFIAFRLLQPYAFDGFGLNPAWLANIREQRIQASPNADLPWNLQWARRSNLFSFTNLTVWGLGLPLGILAWVGFLVMGWRMIKGEWRRHLLLWSWTAGYFVWQSMQYNPTMRYQLPIYPLLAMMAGWVVIWIWDRGRETNISKRVAVTVRTLSAVAAVVVILLTAGWAFGFSSIYTRPETRIAASRWIYENIPGPVNLRIQNADGIVVQQPVPFISGISLSADAPYVSNFTAKSDGLLTEILLYRVTDTASTGVQTLNLAILPSFDSPPDQYIAITSITADFSVGSEMYADSHIVALDQPVGLVKDQSYTLNLTVTGGNLSISGAMVANETDYDYGLPFRVDGYDGFGGIYSGLNLQVYWDDNEEKLTRFLTTLEQADYIFIPTNHQYGQITRLPERYPLTTVYYRALLGCPASQNITSCYRAAEPGMYSGELGFELVSVFDSYPSIGSFEINDQAAEEAFTFYDHPKVFIFAKTEAYDQKQVEQILSAVDLSQVIHMLPGQADDYKSLLLPEDRLSVQAAGGTWSELFDAQAWQNRYPILGLVIWYLFFFILGLCVYPIVRRAFPGLADRGYPLARIVGLLILGYLPWLISSFGVPHTRSLIGITFGLILCVGIWQAYAQRDELVVEWREKRRYFLIVEVMFLTFFFTDLLIRIGNPDLWHPSKGGERPMDFSYFNAVIKSTTFPPYDPWFAQGYINYYYYGFVLVGTPVKLLGIVPSIAYNFILPTLFAMLALGTFSIGYNLLKRGEDPDDRDPQSGERRSLLGGILSSAAVLLIGNLGTYQMIFQGFQRVVAPGGIVPAETGLFQRWSWAAQGFVKVVLGASLPYIRGDWYWFPSRVIPPGPGNEITEFPLFTFVYSDLHAHMIALPLAALAIAWGLSVVFSRGKWLDRRFSPWVFLLGGLAIGSLFPTNLSDIYTYLPLGIVCLVYSLWGYSFKQGDLDEREEKSRPIYRFLVISGSLVLLVGLTVFLYEPYRYWYGQAYGTLDRWQGPFTPIGSYLTQWGFFLFIITSWLAWETRQWLASTPVSALKNLRPYQVLIEISLAVIVAVLLILLILGVNIVLIALPLAVWAGILLLRPNLTDSKRFVLFLVGTGLVITLMVEMFTVRGDIGRMNTIFKFYMHVWTFFAIAAAAALVWLLPELKKWKNRWREPWQVIGVILLTGVLLFTVLGTIDKVRDRVNPDAPHSLDSMRYMAFAQYADFGVLMDLNQDYLAIRWMQENIEGTPVIVEAHTPEYRWGSRYTIYTGLPGVLGWNWHQRQQRVFMHGEVWSRENAINDFYSTTDIHQALDFIETFGVRFIIVGQLERAEYPDEGIIKFKIYEGTYWQTIYHQADTVIYEVMP